MEIDWNEALHTRRKRRPASAGRRRFVYCSSGCGRRIAAYNDDRKECQRCRSEREAAQLAAELRAERRNGEAQPRTWWEPGDGPPPHYNEFPPGF
jgi:hypothetical protein